MKICYLTQTATDISDFYKEFFKGQDLFFVTFKTPNPNALAFVPKSTWSDGRNALWEAVRGKYDYYVFLDDDLKFLKPKLSSSPLLTYAYYRLFYQSSFKSVYEPLKPAAFFARLEHYLTTYKPEVLAPLCFDNMATRLDTAAMRKNSFVRRLGWFDAQCTVLSEYGASKILPYDTKLSGWWSSQIPVYLYSYHVFGKKALAVSDLAVTNNFHAGAYVPDYNGREDVQRMLTEITSATGLDLATHYNERTVIDNCYGEAAILAAIPKPDDTEDYAGNYGTSLSGLEKLLHPGIKP